MFSFALGMMTIGHSIRTTSRTRLCLYQCGGVCYSHLVLGRRSVTLKTTGRWASRTILVSRRAFESFCGTEDDSTAALTVRVSSIGTDTLDTPLRRG